MQLEPQAPDDARDAVATPRHGGIAGGTATLHTPESNHPSRGWALDGGLAAAAHMANDAVTSMLPALLPLLAARFRLVPWELAVLTTVFAVSTSLPQPYFGSLADRFGARRVGATGLAVSGMLVAGLSFVSSVPWLCALLLIGGLGSAALHPAGIGLVRAASANNPGLAVALFTAAGMVGGASGPVLALSITSTWGFGGLPWAAAPVLLLALLFFGLAPRRRAAVALGTGSPSAGLHLLRGPVASLTFVALCANVAVLTFTSAAPLWLVGERGLDEQSPIIGLTLATFSMASAVGGILGGILARRLRPSHLVVGSLALSFVALESVLAATPGSVPYFAAVLAAGVLLYLHAPLVVVRAQELSPGAESTVVGVLVGGTWAAAGVIYLGIGAAQTAFGTRFAMAAAFLVMIPAVHVAARVLRTTAGAPVTATGCERNRAADETPSRRTRRSGVVATITRSAEDAAATTPDRAPAARPSDAAVRRGMRRHGTGSTCERARIRIAWRWVALQRLQPPFPLSGHHGRGQEHRICDGAQ